MKTPIAVVLACALAAVSCGGSAPPQKFKQKMIVLGFDGMEP